MLRRLPYPMALGGALLFFMVLSPVLSAQSLQVMSFNIRYNTSQDGENQWSKRKDNLASMLQFYEVDLCGMQEALVGQIKDVLALRPEYGYLGVGRDDGKEGGEFSPILYRKDRLELLQQATFWLSEQPGTPGKGWDASFPRVVSWGKFKDKKTKKTFFVFNTHFDHRGEVARRESAKLLLTQVKAIAGQTMAIITGDFNATPSDEPIKIIVDQQNAAAFVDTETLSQQGHFGPDSTFNGFESKEQDGRHIDYIFLKNQGKLRVLKHATLSNTWAGRFASDHHAVLVSLQW